MDEGVPLCTSCGHYHAQGVRCSICGHVGKSQIFVKMRVWSESTPLPHFKFIIEQSKGNEKRRMNLSLLCTSESGLQSVPGSVLMTAERALLFEDFCQFCTDHQRQNGDMIEAHSSSSLESGSFNAMQLNVAFNTCAFLQSELLFFHFCCVILTFIVSLLQKETHFWVWFSLISLQDLMIIVILFFKFTEHLCILHIIDLRCAGG